jgi:predicted nucleic-acid-binding protein
MVLRALIALRSVSLEHGPVISRSLDLYEIQHMDFTDAYLVAFAEVNGLTRIASFDRGIDKAIRTISPVKRLAPSRMSNLKWLVF